MGNDSPAPLEARQERLTVIIIVTTHFWSIHYTPGIVVSAWPGPINLSLTAWLRPTPHTEIIPFYR